MIDNAPDMVKSSALTCGWENKLKQVERGEPDSVFMDGIKALVVRTCIAHTAPNPEYAALFSKAPEGEAVGDCLRGGGNVHEHKKGFFRDNRACLFVLWRDNRFFTAQKTIMKSAAQGRHAFMFGLYNEKTGKICDAAIVMGDTGGKYMDFRLDFENAERGGKIGTMVC